MRNQHEKTRLLLTAALLILTPLTAQARFILTDVDFDDVPVGGVLDRRGALFGEPVPGPYDSRLEIIVDQGNGDRAIRMYDQSVGGPTEMYWNLRDDMTLAGGLLTARIEVKPDLGNYTFALRATNQRSDFLAVDVVRDGLSAWFEWRDADSRAGTFIGDLSPGTTYELMVEVDLTYGTYNLWWNGVPIVTNEPHGRQDEELAYFVVGHLPDDDLDGVFEYDLVQLDWRPDDTAVDLLSADFDDMPEGAELQARGAFYGEPVSIISATPPTVETGLPLGTKAMALADSNQSVNSSYAIFEFFGGAEPTNQPVSISFAVSFDELKRYGFIVREQGGVQQSFFKLFFREGGQVLFDDVGGVFASSTYSANTLHTVELAFESDLDYYSVWFDGVRIAHRREHGITDRDVGRMLFKNSLDSDRNGVMRVDSIQAHTLGQPVAVPDPLPATSIPLLDAAPNPFNPNTEVRFELTRAGQVNLDIFDGRGRRVQRLVDGHREAGLHRARWQGRDQTGRRLASGVYYARLESAGGVATKALTLIK